tara:strand:+ start:276 stop:488 length:213 start_codon:yes stop_codon:yes gene_type:complete
MENSKKFGKLTLTQEKQLDAEKLVLFRGGSTCNCTCADGVTTFTSGCTPAEQATATQENCNGQGSTCGEA